MLPGCQTDCEGFVYLYISALCASRVRVAGDLHITGTRPSVVDQSWATLLPAEFSAFLKLEGLACAHVAQRYLAVHQAIPVTSIDGLKVQ